MKTRIEIELIVQVQGCSNRIINKKKRREKQMNRKVFLTIMAILIIGIVGVTIYLLTNKNNDVSQNEIQPQEEVGNDTMRQTIVTLYYQNKETKKQNLAPREVTHLLPSDHSKHIKFHHKDIRKCI